MKIYLLLFLSFSGLQSFAKEIKIGCSHTCNREVTTSLKQISKTLLLKLTIIDLSLIKNIDWNSLDGVIIPGGEDIDPKYYLSFVETDLQEHTRSLDYLVEYTDEGKARDPFEYKLLQDYFSNENLQNFPLLGICRGMQMMAVSLGIPLYVDIKTELGIPNRRDLYDQINVNDADSLMMVLFPNTFFAYKYHHQGLRVPYFQKFKSRWPKVKVTATSNNGKIAESIEISDRPALGIQFHPETDNNMIRKMIFTWFLNKAASSKKE